ncbi:MAG: DUF4339 domain-containing protein [Ginsengibacter sp.]
MKPYFLHDGSVQSGPYSLEELEQKRITGDTLVWKAGMPDWLLARNVEGLKSLFETNDAPPAYKEKPNIPTAEKEDTPTSKNSDKAIESNVKDSKKKLLIIGGIVTVLVAIGLFSFFKNKPQKEIVASSVAAMNKDSVKKEEPVIKDTVAEVDSLTSLLTFDSTKINTKKTDTTTIQSGYIMGGMTINSEKPVPSEKESKKEKKKAPKPEQKRRDNEKPKVQEVRHPTATIKNLIISGSFRKNLLLEAVMEGFIRNPNEQVSFHNITVTVTFINAEGEETGSKNFHQSGVLPAGGNTTFKFKTNAPKGSRTVRYDVSASPID